MIDYFANRLIDYIEYSIIRCSPSPTALDFYDVINCKQIIAPVDLDNWDNWILNEFSVYCYV